MALLRRHPCAEESSEAHALAWRELARRGGARLHDIGTTAEGRAIDCLEIGSRGPVVLLTSLMHGIEIVGAYALRQVMHTLLADDELRDAARYRVVPVVNPDAFAHNVARVRRGERAWRRCNANGVDLNRNFPKMAPASFLHPFAGSRFRRAPHYAGPHAFSEPETRALRDLVVADPPMLSLGFHSFGNMLLYPWAFTDAPNARERDYRRLGAAFNAAAGIRYSVRQAMSLYPTVGDLDDWLDAHFGTLAMTVEIGRPDGALLHPRRLLDPFHWMNTPREEAIRAVAAGVIAMLRHLLLSRQAQRPVPPRDEAQLSLDFAAR